jgi:hypothetical protein
VPEDFMTPLASGQLRVLPANSLFDLRFGLVIPIPRPAPITDAHNDIDATKDISFVGPLMECNFFGPLSELAPLAKVADFSIFAV